MGFLFLRTIPHSSASGKFEIITVPLSITRDLHIFAQGPGLQASIRGFGVEPGAERSIEIAVSC